MDKRAHRRFESHVEAKLIFPNGSSYPCHISDFSQEGLRVFWADNQLLKLSIQDTLDLSIVLEGITTNIPVICLFADKKSAGFQLNRPNPDLFLKLQKLNQASRSNGVLSNEKRSEYKNLFQQRVKETSSRIISQWNNELLEILFSEANGALSNEDQQNFYSAEKQIKTHNKQTERRFLSQIAEQLNCWLESQPAIKSDQQTQNNNQNLSLVQQEDFEFADRS